MDRDRLRSLRTDFEAFFRDRWQPAERKRFRDPKSEEQFLEPYEWLCAEAQRLFAEEFAPLALAIVQAAAEYFRPEDQPPPPPRRKPFVRPDNCDLALQLLFGTHRPFEAGKFCVFWGAILVPGGPIVARGYCDLVREWSSWLVIDDESRPVVRTIGQTMEVVGQFIDTLLLPAPPPSREPTTAEEADSPISHAPTRPAHAVDFRSVNWFGAEYTFTGQQAACVKIWWEHWLRGTADVADATVLEAAEVRSQLRVLFRGHPAWGTMIVEGATKGTHRLADPPKKIG